MVSPHTALDSLRPMDDIFAMAVWSATGFPRGPRLALWIEGVMDSPL